MSKGRDLKPHIAIFGRRNNGKSSLINHLVGQDIAIVSDQPGTTTDPVKKSIEIFGIGPAIIIDTAGIDDVGELGGKRIQKTLETLNIIDCAILVITGNQFGEYEIDLINKFYELNIPFFIIHNKSDLQKLTDQTKKTISQYTDAKIIEYSNLQSNNLQHIIQLLKDTIPPSAYQKVTLFENLVSEKELVVLVMPIDNEAPEGRLILPQVMAIRDLLDHHCIIIALQVDELEYFLSNSSINPRLVVTDSQIFKQVDQIVPAEIPLTGFSILFARLKGDFEAYLNGTPYLENLKDGDNVLIFESCSHHVNCDDIGRFKIPNWLQKFTGKELSFEVVSSFQQTKRNIEEYAIVIQCGGCMFTRKQLQNRLKPAIDKGVPVTNYGMAIAYMHGIFQRATAIFREHDEIQT
ncbi:[FeFe] hydrogenase H-cluster maturation GTPase HydF [Bacteroidales bacterium OttesenSCG-928-B11]|nr:[FeFe] hydrogenase H-cluster maturation GTPase HydF [Bacteroidales bacterium OttesenSCG-928-B11]MDL2326354.1 [FeFe] hydrogenase H-cluster maturation GTPase HydF [Bacteroidales bacterium OttesenSCG-928-A14]